MTVCVAAICAGNFLCGMSDRMLTAGDVKFEPSSSKIWQLSNSIAMMSAGDIGLQTEIHVRLQKIVIDRIKAAPTEWMRVEDAARLYRRAYFDIKKERAEAKILVPLGLDNGVTRI